MLEIFRNENISFVRHIKNILENHKIPCILEELELPLGVVFAPARILLINEKDEKKALKLIEEVFKESSKETKDWVCQQCYTTIEPQFTECWFCTASKA